MFKSVFSRVQGPCPQADSALHKLVHSGRLFVARQARECPAHRAEVKTNEKKLRVMEVTALFCDHAEATPDGRLNIRGVFNELYAPAFPARQDRMVLVGQVIWDREDHGRIPFRIDLKDPGDSPIFTIDGHSDVEARSEGRAPAKTQLVLPLEKVIFADPGEYRVYAEFGGREFSGPSLYLLRSPDAGPS